MKSPHPRDRFGPLLVASKICFRSGLEVQPLCSARTRCKHIWKQRTKLWRNIVLMESLHRDLFRLLLAASKICIRSVLEVQPHMSLRVQQEKESCSAQLLIDFVFFFGPQTLTGCFFQQQMTQWGTSGENANAGTPCVRGSTNQAASRDNCAWCAVASLSNHQVMANPRAGSPSSFRWVATGRFPRIWNLCMKMWRTPCTEIRGSDIRCSLTERWKKNSSHIAESNHLGTHTCSLHLALPESLISRIVSFPFLTICAHSS